MLVLHMGGIYELHHDMLAKLHEDRSRHAIRGAHKSDM
jgi:hypothetical protein